MMYNIRSSAIRWQLHDFLSDGNSNIYSNSHRLRDIQIFKNQIKSKKYDLENEGEKTGTYAVRLGMFEFIYR